MDNNVENFPTLEHKLVVHPNNVLEGAIDKLTKVLVIGVDKNGDLYCGCSHYEAEASLLLLRGQNFLIKLSGDNENGNA